MIPGQDGYFDNDSILKQFERLFQMLEFKENYNKIVKHDFEIVVDNARTHTKQNININEFRLKPGGNCPVEFLRWRDENNNECQLDCYFRDGELDGMSKGLKHIASELGILTLEENILCNDLKKLLAVHPAFFSESKLECLAKTYGVKITFCPKYHCEMNPIEGLWCNSKRYVRSRTNQTHAKMCSLISESREHFIDINLYIKLIRRFWRVLSAYKNGNSYQEVISTYFSWKSKGNNKNHTIISNTNL